MERDQSTYMQFSSSVDSLKFNNTKKHMHNVHVLTRIVMAIRTGLEPATSSVTGWHSNQLNYRTSYKYLYFLIFF